MIYEAASEANSNSNNTVVQTTNSHHQIVFENGLSQSHHHPSAATESAKIATEPSHDINLPNDEDLLKRLENADNPDAIVTGKNFTFFDCINSTFGAKIQICYLQFRAKIQIFSMHEISR